MDVKGWVSDHTHIPFVIPTTVFTSTSTEINDVSYQDDVQHVTPAIWDVISIIHKNTSRHLSGWITENREYLACFCFAQLLLRKCSFDKPATSKLFADACSRWSEHHLSSMIAMYATTRIWKCPSSRGLGQFPPFLATRQISRTSFHNFPNLFCLCDSSVWDRDKICRS